MHWKFIRGFLFSCLLVSCAWSQQPNSCESLTNFKAENVEITKAAAIAAGTTEPNPWGPGHSAPLPPYCRVEGVMNRRTGLDGEEFGISDAAEIRAKRVRKKKTDREDARLILLACP